MFEYFNVLFLFKSTESIEHHKVSKKITSQFKVLSGMEWQGREKGRNSIKSFAL